MYYHANQSSDKLLAEFFEIDQNKVEQEKRTMLELIREANAKRGPEARG